MGESLKKYYVKQSSAWQGHREQESSLCCSRGLTWGSHSAAVGFHLRVVLEMDK